MFVQMIQGRVSDAAALRGALERWVEELAPGASGWLGTTAGVSEDGRGVVLARFESAEDARRNSDRAEQGEWWSDASGAFAGDVTFADSETVSLDLTGDPDGAGFVQIIQGRTSDPDRARELMRPSSSTAAWADFRPDLLGSLTLEHDGGAFATVVYFTSEEEAREGERKELPGELAAEMEEMNALTIGQPDYLDIKEPWLHSPR